MIATYKLQQLAYLHQIYPPMGSINSEGQNRQISREKNSKYVEENKYVIKYLNMPTIVTTIILK